jgi:hypothetical protein
MQQSSAVAPAPSLDETEYHTVAQRKVAVVRPLERAPLLADNVVDVEAHPHGWRAQYGGELNDSNSLPADEIDDPYSHLFTSECTDSMFGLTIFVAKVAHNLPRIVQQFTNLDIGIKTVYNYTELVQWMEGNHWILPVPFLLVSFTIQLAQVILMWNIWFSLDELPNSPFCENSSLMQVIIVAVVVIQFFLELKSCEQEFKMLASVSFVCTKEKPRDGRLVLYPCYSNSFFIRMCLGFEQILLIVYAAVGTRYVLQQSGASNIVQACVALQFILDFDNYVFALLIPDAMKEIIHSVKFVFLWTLQTTPLLVVVCSEGLGGDFP